MAEFEDAVPRFRPCPACGGVDQVKNVAVVREHALETTSTAVSGPTVFLGPDQPAIPGAIEHRTVRRPTPLGRRLSPAPQNTARPLATLGVFFGAVSAGLFYLDRSAFQDTAGSVQSPFPGQPTVGSVPSYVSGPTTAAAQSPLPVAVPVALGVLCVVLVLLAVVVRHRSGPVRRGRTKAEEASRLGWYCGRCGTVYFQPGTAPEGAQDSKSYSLEEFRRFVFRAGGYEHLVNVRSVR